jgi:hypothetical protein
MLINREAFLLSVMLSQPSYVSFTILYTMGYHNHATMVVQEHHVWVLCVKQPPG